MHVKINTAALVDSEVPISDSAAQLVRMGFNPSSMSRVDQVKALSAALISVCETIQTENPSGGREAAIAITDIQKASMMGVAGATAGL